MNDQFSVSVMVNNLELLGNYEFFMVANIFPNNFICPLESSGNSNNEQLWIEVMTNLTD